MWRTEGLEELLGAERLGAYGGRRCRGRRRAAAHTRTGERCSRHGGGRGAERCRTSRVGTSCSNRSAALWFQQWQPIQTTQKWRHNGKDSAQAEGGGRGLTHPAALAFSDRFSSACK